MDIAFLVIERKLPILTLVIFQAGFDYQFLLVDVLCLPHRHVFLTNDMHSCTHVLINEFTRHWVTH